MSNTINLYKSCIGLLVLTSFFWFLLIVSLSFFRFAEVPARAAASLRQGDARHFAVQEGRQRLLSLIVKTSNEDLEGPEAILKVPSFDLRSRFIVLLTFICAFFPLFVFLKAASL